MTHGPMTFDQIARELQMNRSTVVSVYYRALDKLRKRRAKQLRELRDLARQLQAERRAHA